MSKGKAVVLQSGGLDSTTTLAIAKHEGYQINALTFRYGQRHEVEIQAARRVAEHFGVTEHHIAQIDLAAFGGSALTEKGRVSHSGSVSFSLSWARYCCSQAP